MIISKQPMVVCKKCGNRAPADSFVLDHLQGMMVCQDCIKGRKSNKGTATLAVPEEKKEPTKPPGWDSEDEYLEKAYKQKLRTNTSFERIDDNTGRYTCMKCKYEFVYNTTKRYPAMCPNCGTKVIASGL